MREHEPGTPSQAAANSLTSRSCERCPVLAALVAVVRSMPSANIAQKEDANTDLEEPLYSVK